MNLHPSCPYKTSATYCCFNFSQLLILVHYLSDSSQKVSRTRRKGDALCFEQGHLGFPQLNAARDAQELYVSTTGIGPCDLPGILRCPGLTLIDGYTRSSIVLGEADCQEKIMNGSPRRGLWGFRWGAAKYDQVQSLRHCIVLGNFIVVSSRATIRPETYNLLHLVMTA